jgi:uncharacterized membrane protein
MKLAEISLVAATVFTSLMAGIFFAFTVSVMPGLGKLSDAGFLSAMQSINREIQNPVFFLVFFGVLILLPFAIYLHYHADRSAFLLLTAATLVYFIGVFGVTILGNIPLNNQLDQFDIARATPENLQSFRAHFEGKWNTFNSVRTVSSLLAAVIMVYTCLLKTGKIN